VERPSFIELGQKRDLIRIPILYEDRSVIAIDKPAGWLLIPFSWQRTQRNLQAAITSSIAGGDYWARSRNLKVLRAVHRLDGDTSGILLMSKSLGGVESFGDMFESRKMTKVYLAVVHGAPKRSEWRCEAPLGPASGKIGRVVVDRHNGKPADTSFRVLSAGEPWSLVEARPVTGRTHQIRVHLLEAGHPVVGDDIYGPNADARVRQGGRTRTQFPMGLRAVHLNYVDPFQRKPVRIQAPTEEFLRAFGMRIDDIGCPS
jgi:23S rRNA pseudouridine1911/1915/1917 synthase